MKLISMTDFVLNGQETSDYIKLYDGCFKYAHFLKQKLNLSMFIPLDKNGNILTEPINYSAFEAGMSGKDFHFNFVDCQEYKEAKSKVLFDGFQAIKWEHGGNSYSLRKNNGTENEIQVCYYKAIPDYFVWSLDTIEQLCTKDLYLTEYAIKQIQP